MEIQTDDDQRQSGERGYHGDCDFHTGRVIRERRSVSIPNPAGLEGFAQYFLMVGPGSKVVDLQAVSSDDSLTGLKDAAEHDDAPVIS